MRSVGRSVDGPTDGWWLDYTALRFLSPCTRNRGSTEISPFFSLSNFLCKMVNIAPAQEEKKKSLANDSPCARYRGEEGGAEKFPLSFSSSTFPNAVPLGSFPFADSIPPPPATATFPPFPPAFEAQQPSQKKRGFCKCTQKTDLPFLTATVERGKGEDLWKKLLHRSSGSALIRLSPSWVGWDWDLLYTVDKREG